MENKTVKPSIRGLAVEILEKVELKNSFSNIVLDQTIKKEKLDQQDINILTELVYGVMQRKRALDYQLDPFIRKQKKIKTWVKQLLRVSLYQMEYLDRIPDYAIINEAVEYAKKKGHKGISGLVNGVLRNITRTELASFEDIEPVQKRIAIQHSLPDWLVERFIKDYGEAETEKLAVSLNEKPKVSIRVNVNLISRKEAQSRLQEEGYETTESELSPYGLISESGMVTSSSLFKEGLITIQDESSMLVAPALQIEPHHKVLDACAAPGGKTTHIATYLDTDKGGKVTALDLHKHKVKLIEDSAKRQQAEAVVEALQMDAREVPEHFEKESFDRVLVDAPCSGLGLLRRKPDIRYTKTPEDVASLEKIQLAILSKAAEALKPGGLIVYSTCTILKNENENVVYQFLNQNPEFQIKSVFVDNEGLMKSGEEFLTILPHEYQSDGFFISCLQKKQAC